MVLAGRALIAIWTMRMSHFLGTRFHFAFSKTEELVKTPTVPFDPGLRAY
jgi:hypothetical protein